MRQNCVHARVQAHHGGFAVSARLKVLRGLCPAYLLACARNNLSIDPSRRVGKSESAFAIIHIQIRPKPAPKL